MTPLVDVMLILLVFFMVTSTYLDLDMIPVAQPADAAPPSAGGSPAAAGSEGGAAMLVRLDPGGVAWLRGRPHDADALTQAILAADAPRVLVLPSGAAPAQALVDVLEAAERGGAAETQVVRLGGEIR